MLDGNRYISQSVSLGVIYFMLLFYTSQAGRFEKILRLVALFLFRIIYESHIQKRSNVCQLGQ